MNCLKTSIFTCNPTKSKLIFIYTERLEEKSSYLNLFQNDLEVLNEKKKFEEIEKKKIKSLSGASEVINNLYKKVDAEAANFLDILSLKINYFNSISEHVKQANPNFLEHLKQRFSVFFSLLEKKTAKVLVVYRHVFKEMNIKNLICNMVYYNLFLRKIQAYFKSDVSKYIVKYMHDIIIDNLKFNNLQAIRKIGILLSGDNWKRVALQDDHQ